MSERSRSVERQPHGPGRHGPRPSGPIAMPGEKAKDFKGTLRKLIAYIGRYKWTVLIVWMIAVLSTVFMIVGPKILGQATDELFQGILGTVTATGEGINFAHIGSILLWLAGLYGASALFSYFQGFIMTGVTMKVTYQLRKDIDEKIHRLPLGYYDKTTHGDVLSRITNDVDAISQSLNQSITQIITSITSVLGILVMMLTISWQLTLIELLIIPLSILFIGLIVKKSQKYFVGQQKYLGKVNGHVEEMYGGHAVVKAFNYETRSVGIFEKTNDKLFQYGWKAQFVTSVIFPVLNFIGNLTFVAICVFGGYMTATGRITLGAVQAFISYSRQFNHPIQQVSQIVNVLQSTVAAAERVFEILEQPEQVPDPFDAVTNEDPEGKVDFDHVSFRYVPEKPLIEDLSIHVKPGQLVAIVGPTGAGKTTLVNLLMRFYEVDKGIIEVDDIDITRMSRKGLHFQIGMVLQDTWLFKGTIGENIAFGKRGATEEEIIHAAKLAYADGFIRTLPNGYDTEINEEATNISQGQKQLLTIARALIVRPRIMILDEATSSVDTRTEVLVQKAMKRIMNRHTSFVIAHRLSTIRDADNILVMNDGDIVEQGKHEELLAKKGFYFKLYNSQFTA